MTPNYKHRSLGRAVTGVAEYSDPLRIKSFEENLNDGCKNKAKTSSKKVGGDFEQRFGVCA